jgi:hypothetical protein
MTHPSSSVESLPLVHPGHARWVLGVLAMLIGVVRKDSILGLILSQTRRDIHTLLQGRSKAG